MPAKVIIFDDDSFQIPFYERTLSAAGFTVVHIKTTGAVRPILNGKQHKDSSFFIVDMMMPPGTLYESEATAAGLYTGLFLARDLRAKFPIVPIILWTAAHVDGVREAAKQHSIRIPNCTYIHKLQAMPNELADALRHYQKKNTFRRGFFSRLWRAASIRPSVGGIGLDVKELTK